MRQWQLNGNSVSSNERVSYHPPSTTVNLEINVGTFFFANGNRRNLTLLLNEPAALASSASDCLQKCWRGEIIQISDVERFNLSSSINQGRNQNHQSIVSLIAFPCVSRWARISVRTSFENKWALRWNNIFVNKIRFDSRLSVCL